MAREWINMTFASLTVMNWLDKYRNWLAQITPRVLLCAAPGIAVIYATFSLLWAWRNPGCEFSDYIADMNRSAGAPARCSGTAEIRATLYWIISFGPGMLVTWPLHYLMFVRGRR